MCYVKHQYIFIGISIPTKNAGSIVSFAIYERDQPTYERTKERHDILLQQLRTNKIELAGFTNYRGWRALIERHQNTEKNDGSIKLNVSYICSIYSSVIPSLRAKHCL